MSVCPNCKQERVVTRTPTDDGKSMVNTTRCGCSILSYREDLAAKVCAK